MLNKLIVTLVLLSFVAAVDAQNDDNKTDDAENKRPSWSKGLPERQKTTDLKTTEFKPDIDNEIELDMSEFGLQEKPKIEIELPINTEIGVRQSSDSDAESEVVEPVVESEPEPEPEPEPIAVESVVNEAVEDEPVETEAVVIEELPGEAPAEEDSNLVLETEEPVVETNLAEEDELNLSTDEAAVLSVNADEESGNEVVAEATNEVVEPVSAEPVESEAVSSINEAESDNTTTTTAADAAVIETAEEAVDEENGTNYEWKIVDRKAVVYPPRAAIQNLEGWVDVEITINPAGEVVSASPVKYSRKGRIFGKNAVQSVNDWLFDPPSSYGISDNITRIYRIEFDL
uniref:TonB family protein n=1 Tax=Marinicella marina TaxID=2996016 RepID=UPI0022608DE2|nr:TonB family protein [Marinicella marina]MCX7554074.1 TonB family protein [Marinicella marina]MDJ1141233.1 TonB family protein [Marinicella marina]